MKASQQLTKEAFDAHGITHVRPMSSPDKLLVCTQ